jgi:hypothetical protein
VSAVVICPHGRATDVCFNCVTARTAQDERPRRPEGSSSGVAPGPSREVPSGAGMCGGMRVGRVIVCAETGSRAACRIGKDCNQS